MEIRAEYLLWPQSLNKNEATVANRAICLKLIFVLQIWRLMKFICVINTLHFNIAESNSNFYAVYERDIKPLEDEYHLNVKVHSIFYYTTHAIIFINSPPMNSHLNSVKALKF